MAQKGKKKNRMELWLWEQSRVREITHIKTIEPVKFGILCGLIQKAWRPLEVFKLLEQHQIFQACYEERIFSLLMNRPEIRLKSSRAAEIPARDAEDPSKKIMRSSAKQKWETWELRPKGWYPISPLWNLDDNKLEKASREIINRARLIGSPWRKTRVPLKYPQRSPLTLTENKILEIHSLIQCTNT